MALCGMNIAGQRQTNLAMNQRTGIAELENGLSLDGVPNVVESPYLTCSCGAGKCIVLTKKDGKDAGRKYFACPVEKGLKIVLLRYGLGSLEKSLNQTRDRRKAHDCFKNGEN